MEVLNKNEAWKFKTKLYIFYIFPFSLGKGGIAPSWSKNSNILGSNIIFWFSSYCERWTHYKDKVFRIVLGEKYVTPMTHKKERGWGKLVLARKNAEGQRKSGVEGVLWETYRGERELLDRQLFFIFNLYLE